MRADRFHGCLLFFPEREQCRYLCFLPHRATINDEFNLFMGEHSMCFTGVFLPGWQEDGQRKKHDGGAIRGKETACDWEERSATKIFPSSKRN